MIYNNLIKHGKFIILWGLLFAFIILVISLFFPKYYKAEADLLVRPAASDSTDPYALSRASESMGESLSQIISTTDFYNKLIANNEKLNKERWGDLSSKKQRKQWAEDVSASMSYGTSLLHVSVYAKNKDESLKLAKAVSETLSVRGWEYVGSNVVVKQVNNPIVSRLPQKPNFILNMVLGFVLGVLLSSFLVIKYKS